MKLKSFEHYNLDKKTYIPGTKENRLGALRQYTYYKTDTITVSGIHHLHAFYEEVQKCLYLFD